MIVMHFGFRGLLAGMAMWFVATSANAVTMNYLSTWVGTTSYSIGSVIVYNNEVYYAVAASRNSIPSPTNTAWKFIGRNGMDYKGAWSNTTTYQVGAVVNYSGQNYYSLLATNLNRNPTTQTAYWVLVGTNGNTIKSGAGAPLSTQGSVGDFWIDTTNKIIYGPKAVSGWPLLGTNMVGAQGPKGDPGAAGATGPAGPAGATGPTGATGAVGATGPAGTQGPAGSDGAAGPAGPAGVAGPAGPTGPAGVAGPAGPAGVAGPAGPIGPAGAAGTDGATGATGPAGTTESMGSRCASGGNIVGFYADGNILCSNGPSDYTSNNWSLTVYNIDDTMEVYVNGTLRATCQFATGTTGCTYNLNTWMQTGANSVKIELTNTVSGYSYAYRLVNNGTTQQEYECGAWNQGWCDVGDGGLKTGVIMTKSWSLLYKP